MTSINMYCLFLIFIYLCYINGTSVYFGKFKVKLIALDKCKGPKMLDCCSIDWKVQNGNLIHYSLYAPEDIAPLRARVTLSTNGKGILRLQMNKICDNPFMKPFFKSIANITDDCVVLKGSYKLTVDIENLIQKYYAGEFFYGNITVHSIIYNSKCNFSCAHLKATLLPKE